MKGDGVCRECGVAIIWARHVKSGKPAPLVEAKESEKANIYAAPMPPDMEWMYRIAGTAASDANDPVRPKYLNHFANCPARAKFKTSPEGETK